jgi:hypothetical protein
MKASLAWFIGQANGYFGEQKMELAGEIRGRGRVGCKERIDKKKQKNSEQY